MNTGLQIRAVSRFVADTSGKGLIDDVRIYNRTVPP